MSERNTAKQPSVSEGWRRTRALGVNHVDPVHGSDPEQTPYTDLTPYMTPCRPRTCFPPRDVDLS
jgi:hypothetical protein